MAISEQERTTLSMLYPEQGAHGSEHIEQMLEVVDQVFQEPECRLLTIEDREDIRTAAIFHDTGYKESELYWSGTQWEHPWESDKIFRKFILNNPILDRGPKRNAFVRYLILNHDNTSHQFPAYKYFEGLRREGFIEVYGFTNLPPGMHFAPDDVMDQLEKTDGRKIDLMLAVIQEADSRLGSAQRTIDFCKSRGIPIFADDGRLPGIGMPMWQWSGLANVLLAANRAIIDAYTKTGQEYAWKMFCETRDFIRGMTEEELRKNHSKYTFFGDNVGELLRREDVEKYIWGSKNGDRFRECVRIQAAYPLESASLPLGIGFTKLASRLVGLEQLSFPTCIPEGYMADLALIRESLIKNYAIDILTQLSGSVEVITDGFLPDKRVMYRKFVLAPPVIDKDGELAEFSDNLENAGAWIALAKILKLPKLRVLYLS